jgi:hypothetical protein
MLPTNEPDTDFVHKARRIIPTLFWDHWGGIKKNAFNSLRGFCGACQRLVLTIRANASTSSLQLAYDVWTMHNNNSMYAIIECGIQHSRENKINPEIASHITDVLEDVDQILPMSLFVLLDFGYFSWGQKWNEAATDFQLADVAAIKEIVTSKANTSMKPWLRSNMQILLPSDTHTEIQTRSTFTGLPDMWPYPSLEHINVQRRD